MPNPFANKRLPIQGMFPEGEPDMMEALEETMEEPVIEEQELEVPSSGSLLNPMQVLYHDENEACGSCEYFIEDGADCQKVQGPISQSGWCVVHSARGGGQMQEETLEEDIMPLEMGG